NGSIDVYSPSSGRWRYIRDIAIADRVQKSITSLFALGDSMYIGSSFGVSLFSISRFRFVDTYANFGNTMTPPVLSVRADGKRVYAVLANGIAVSDSTAKNLAAPDSWKRYPMDNAATSLALVDGHVFAGGGNGLIELVGTSWRTIPAASHPVTIVGQSGSQLFFTRDKNIFSYSINGTIRQIGVELPSRVTSATNASETLIFGTESGGVARWESASGRWIFFAPNGPASNSFTSIVMDEDGILWCASGKEYGSGFYTYNGERWTNYSTSTIPEMHSNDCYGVAIGPNNSKWISTWGAGIVLFDSEGKFVRTFDHKNPGFTGPAGTPAYTVPAVVSADKDGNVWTSIYQTSDLSKVVWKMQPDSQWVAYPAPLNDYNQMLGVVVDQNKTKWFTNQLPGYTPKAGIVFLNEKGAVSGTTSNGWGTLSEKNGAPSSVVFSIVEDRDGIVWMGTTLGIFSIANSTNPFKSVLRPRLNAAREQYVYCIAIDALNNKWLGTSHGVFVVSPDGETLIDQYTVAGTGGKLVDDNIYSIAFDKKAGVAYLGTGKGLSSISIKTVAPALDYSEMTAYPNPFRTESQPYVTITGLAEGSTIKILTLNASLVKEFAAQGGGRAFWDGKTETGEPVASGIYIAIAYNALGGQVGRAKIAVIR
ncbi:MAG TPA: two-component regulator propeller domain-containing protein, partial [Bacteroidota bacterium]|nr:two-component regulator propeller domain-containing protein [Bacteroidota bacterium]